MHPEPDNVWIYSFRLLPLLPWVQEDERWNINNSTHFLVTKSWHIIVSLLSAWVDPELLDQPNQTVETNLPKLLPGSEMQDVEVEFEILWLYLSCLTSALCVTFYFFSDVFYFNLWWCEKHMSLDRFVQLLFRHKNDLFTTISDVSNLCCF